MAADAPTVARPRVLDRLPRGDLGRSVSRALLAIASVGAGVLVWHLISRNYTPYFLPGPALVAEGAVELARDGTLASSLWSSGRRVLSGWGMGVLAGVPLGLVMGCSRVVRTMLDPYIQFFRFIPPIAFVTLALIWLGPGEASKVALIFYTTIFIVALNTLAGVLTIDELKLRAARSLGARPRQIVQSVILPATVPHAVTGARLAMGNSFLTIVSAEMVAAQTGLGSLIWTARNYAKTEWVFVGIIALGLLGYVFDWVLRTVTNVAFKRYGVTS